MKLGIVISRGCDVIGPKRVQAFSEEMIVSVSGSKYHSAAVTSKGELHTWYGLLGYLEM